MPKFISWLKKQKKRDDPIGDLAGDMIDDKFKLNPESPSNTYDQLKSRIRIKSNDSSGALKALDEAWAEFNKVKKV
jgi:hypothetical protein